jgi:hypothetical protein
MRLAAGLLWAGFLVMLPLAGVLLSGRSLVPFLEFPPRTPFIAHAPFSGAVFGALGLTILAVLVPLLWGLQCAGGEGRGKQTPAAGRFPRWGTAGVAVLLGAWILAWNRFPWFEALQPHTFPLLWVPFIIVVNGLCLRRTGRCPMTEAPGRFLLLFPVSALFWWFFEYLNRFVQNWAYSGAGYTPVTYFLLASLSFATVLPAVVSVHAWLASFPRITHTWRGRAFPPMLGHPGVRWVGLGLAALGLGGVGVWPDTLFPLLWLSPLVIVAALGAAFGAPNPLAGVFHGDWSAPVSAALAGLVCGVFWEMWNFHSLARWEYSIPYVHRFLVFEMPLLGYAGYWPFGLECLLVSHMVMHPSSTARGRAGLRSRRGSPGGG